MSCFDSLRPKEEREKRTTQSYLERKEGREKPTKKVLGPQSKEKRREKIPFHVSLLRQIICFCSVFSFGRRGKEKNLLSASSSSLPTLLKRGKKGNEELGEFRKFTFSRNYALRENREAFQNRKNDKIISHCMIAKFLATIKMKYFFAHYKKSFRFDVVTLSSTQYLYATICQILCGIVRMQDGEKRRRRNR